MYQARLKVVAEKGPNDLTNKVMHSVLGNFTGFNAGKYTGPLHIDNAISDGYRSLSINPLQKRSTPIEVNGDQKFPSVNLEIAAEKGTSVNGATRFADFEFYPGYHLRESDDNPLTVVEFLLKPVTGDEKKDMKVGCGTVYDLLNLKGMKLSSKEKLTFTPYVKSDDEEYYQSSATQNLGFEQYDFKRFTEFDVEKLMEAFNKAGEISEELSDVSGDKLPWGLFEDLKVESDQDTEEVDSDFETLGLEGTLPDDYYTQMFKASRR